MDHISHGVKTTVIDLGLARMDADDGTESHTQWTPFEEEIFEGEGELPVSYAESRLTRPPQTFLGDYQFDVYRMMKLHNKGQWDVYRPLTNVMVRRLLQEFITRELTQITVAALSGRETLAREMSSCASSFSQEYCCRDLQRDRMLPMPPCR